MGVKEAYNSTFRVFKDMRPDSCCVDPAAPPFVRALPAYAPRCSQAGKFMGLEDYGTQRSLVKVLNATRPEGSC